jgi:predicted adenine nucleotide alpha hydrolase (AANH) superfamily ATPase
MAIMLLHTCCGPCFLGTWEDLKSSDFDVVNYFYNPNIHPEKEHDLRLENMKKAAYGRSKDIIVENYEPKKHREAIKGFEDKFPERCIYCYVLRLNQTAKKAKDEGFDLFSTTLLVSPYQQHEELIRLGNTIGNKYGVEFFYKDWRLFFRAGQSIAKENDIYRQKYCGCIYSKNEG